MARITLIVALLNWFHISQILCSAKLPGPLVYVVTPAPRSLQIDMGRSAPFYYRNWMKRMDTPQNITTTTTEKIKTPDLIFAEFESNSQNMKSIRNLLEKEKIEAKRTTTTTTTTSLPIYVPDEEGSSIESNYREPEPSTETPKKTDMTDYFAYYNNLYNTGPVYVPPISSSSSEATTTTTSTTELPNNIENIWHIIDSEKHDKYNGKWEEEPINSDQPIENNNNEESADSEKNKEPETVALDDNFALPGFGTNPGNDGENESRAIRTEPNFRFPYIDLKPFQMKNMKKPEYSNYSNSKKGIHNMLNLDSFTDIKNPVRGEVQEPINMHQPIDRFNPAQPYLPTYGPKYPQSSGPSAPPGPSIPSAPPAPPPPPAPSPPRAVASLVPPPPPKDFDDFPTPKTYDSFPPYSPGAPVPKPSIISYKPPYMPAYQPPSDATPDSSDSDEPPPDIGYRYKAPAPAPAPTSTPFAPTIALPLPSPPFQGYSYDKPPVYNFPPPAMDAPSKPDFQGYHYSKPAPPPPMESPPTYGNQDHDHDGPPPSYQLDNDYPELIFDKHHGKPKEEDGKGDDMGMMPPPPPPANDKPDMDAQGPPSDDNHGFPHDFPGDLKFHHDFDFDDHDHYHHHHHTTTTTTTTEMPRVNRYSYYYLGKKLYYLPLYFSVYFIIYVGALIIKAVLRHKIVYPNSWRPNDQTASFFSKRSIEEHLTNENLHEMTGRVTRAIATVAEKYVNDRRKDN